jgi:hypothetical protein
LLSFTAKLLLVTQQPFTSSACRKHGSHHRAKKFFGPELLSDNLSDVPEDIFSDGESDSDDSVRENKKLSSQTKLQ